MRIEFSRSTKRHILKRSGGICERHLWRRGEPCTKPAREFDHILADGLGGEATVINGAHLCLACHREKSGKEDTPRMRKADAQREALYKVTNKRHRPMPGSRASGLKKHMDGRVTRR